MVREEQTGSLISRQLGKFAVGANTTADLSIESTARGGETPLSADSFEKVGRGFHERKVRA
jgi:hypothetical protein